MCKSLEKSETSDMHAPATYKIQAAIKFHFHDIILSQMLAKELKQKINKNHQFYIFGLTLSSFWKYSLRKLIGLSGLETQS